MRGIFKEGCVMKKIGSLTARALKVMLVLLFVISVSPARAKAENVTIAEYSNTVTSKAFKEYKLDKSKYDETRSNIPSSFTIGEVGDTFTAYYPDAVTAEDGTKRSVKVDITYNGYNDYKAAGDKGAKENGGRGVRLESDKDIRINAMGMDYNITYSFYEDSDFAVPSKMRAAVAFEDPDEGNYYFPGADSRRYYFIDAEDKYGKHMHLGDYYYVTSEGIIHSMKDDKTYSSWPDFDNGTIGVLLNNESSFSFKLEGKHDILYLMVRIILVYTQYKVEYYYETPEGYPEKPDYTSDPIEVDVYETPVVKIKDSDKVPNPEKGNGYKLDESKNQEWEKEVKEDGSTVLKVYFNEAYTIKYDKNADDATGSMSDNTYVKSAPTMPSASEWTFVRPGYEFVGFTVEDPKSEDIHKGSEDFKDTLLKEADRQIVLYAQWNPLDYKIVYNKNADDATGEMPDNEYTGADKTMPSDETWKFVRPGYKFIGYKIENEGDIFTDPKDFRETLLKETDRTVELFAQWEELPYTIKYNSNGGTGEMADDEYKGSDKTMPSKEEWTFTREGYDFTGFKLENKGELLNGSKEYRDTLLDDEDGVITLYAQWEPWKYTIKYDANGGTGTMDDHVYTYADPVMNSDPNKFKRNGYKFLGFVYTDPDGKQTLYKNINDFRAELVKLGKNSEILLVAQWKKNPVISPEVHYYPPVTGIE